MRKTIFIWIVIALIATGCKTPVSVRLFPTATSSIPAAPAALPTPTAAPTIPPIPTPPPAVRIEIAENSLFLGNYEQARREFQEAQAGSSDPEIQAAGAVGMGQALYMSGNYSTAIDALRSAISVYPQGAQTANAYFFLAQSLDAQDIYDQAAEAYAKFLELRPGVIDAYVQELRGDAYMAAGNPAAAAEAYNAAIVAPQEGTTVWTELKLGKAYSAMSDFTNAIKTYLHVYDNSSNDFARAQANLLMGQAYLVLDEKEQAHTRFLDSVTNFPKSYDTYSGLVQLVNDGVEVSELSRGIIDYYAGQYGLAVEAFTRYIETTAEPGAAPYHYRALSRMAQNEIGLAIEDWDYVINTYAADPLWPSAWDEKSYAQWAYLDQYDEAAQTLLNYVATAPESAQAPEFLFMAARILERNNRLVEAAATWEQIMEDYPQAEKSYRGLFLAGVTYYRAVDFPRALTIFQRALVLANDAAEQSAAYLWIGKTHQISGDLAAAQNAWRQGAQLDPTGYYSERANELLLDKAPFTISSPVDLGYDLALERGEAEQWLRSTFSIPAEMDLNGLADLSSDPRVIRGIAFRELGLYSLARAEFESLRSAYASETVRT